MHIVYGTIVLKSKEGITIKLADGQKIFANWGSAHEVRRENGRHSFGESIQIRLGDNSRVVVNFNDSSKTVIQWGTLEVDVRPHAHPVFRPKQFRRRQRPHHSRHHLTGGNIPVEERKEKHNGASPPLVAEIPPGEWKPNPSNPQLQKFQKRYAQAAA